MKNGKILTLETTRDYALNELYVRKAKILVWTAARPARTLGPPPKWLQIWPEEKASGLKHS